MEHFSEDPQRCLDETREVWEVASAAMAQGQFQAAADRYGRAIALLEHVGSRAQGSLLDWIKGNLANAHADRGACLLSLRGPKINKAARSLLRAIAYGNREEAILNNALYCLHWANTFSSEAIAKPPPGATDAFIRYHDDGNGRLRRSWPPGTPGRDWAGAAEMFRRALEVLPTSAASYCGLGLALEGLSQEGIKTKMDAISAWASALQHDPNYDFDYRIIYDRAILP